MMMDSYLFIFFRFCLIIIEFFLFVMLFISKAPKRKFWIVRLIATISLLIGLIAIICIPLNSFYKMIGFDRNIVSISTTVVTLAILSLLAVGLGFSFDIPLYELMSNVYIGYAFRQIVFSIYSLLLNAINPDLLLIRI